MKSLNVEEKFKEIAMDWSKYAPEFKPEEFECKCGCGLQNMKESHMNRLIIARRKAGIPFRIASGCRCEKHNKDEGGTESSDHLGGTGTDITVSNGVERWLVVTALIAAGFLRIGVAKTFVHAGNDITNPQFVLWVY